MICLMFCNHAIIIIFAGDFVSIERPFHLKSGTRYQRGGLRRAKTNNFHAEHNRYKNTSDDVIASDT